MLVLHLTQNAWAPDNWREFPGLVLGNQGIRGLTPYGGPSRSGDTPKSGTIK